MADADVVTSDVNTRNNNACRSELLCFVLDKCNVMAFDHLSKICSDFYTEDEVIAGRHLLEQYTPTRLTRRKGADRLRATVDDIIKVCLDPAIELPAFFAIDLSRLPPVEATHCDITAILRELQLLRHEVRQISSLREEVTNLKLCCTKYENDLQSLTEEVKCLGGNGADFPPLPKSDNITTATPAGAVPMNDHSAANRLKSAIASGAIVRSSQKKGKSVVGKSVNPKLQAIKSVMTTRKVDIFVSRLHPLTAASELADCVNTSKTDISVHDIVCNKLNSKYEDLYSSFHVEITVDSADLKRAVDLFMSADSWPVGIFVKRFFKRKDGRDHNVQ